MFHLKKITSFPRLPIRNIVSTYRWVNTTNAKDLEALSRCFSEAIERNDKLAYYGKDSISRTYNALLKTGFTHENCMTIIDTHPNVLCHSEQQIAKRLELWRVARFSRSQFFELFVQCPELIDIADEHYIVKRYTQLQEIAVTPKNIWRLLMSSPNIMVDNIKQTQEKVDYITISMESDITDLVKSGALALQLNKIKCRHMILVRLGIFKRKNRKISELSSNKNPRLFRIMDCDDKEFAEKTCGISIKELDAFVELFERELEEKAQEIIDYEEDDIDDSDDPDFDARENDDFYDDRNRRKYHKKK